MTPDQAHATSIQEIRQDEFLPIRTKAAIKDELVYQLSCKRQLDWDKLLRDIKFQVPIDWDESQIHQKYYDRAEFVLWRINTWNPATPPIFVINTSDLTRSLRDELEDLQNTDSRGFDKVVTEAIQTILEGINSRYYHIAGLPYRVTWRFEP